MTLKWLFKKDWRKWFTNFIWGLSNDASKILSKIYRTLNKGRESKEKHERKFSCNCQPDNTNYGSYNTYYAIGLSLGPNTHTCIKIITTQDRDTPLKDNREKQLAKNKKKQEKKYV